MRLAASTLVICVSALITLGLVMLYSAGMTQNGGRLLTMQLVWCGVGLAACAFMAWLDYAWLQRFALPLFGLAIVLLALVLVVGLDIKGARRWFTLGIAQFQPSEFGKLALVVGLAWYGARFQRRMPELFRGLVVPGAFALLLLGLVFIEPDRGCTILLAGITGAMLVVAGARLRYIIPPGLVFLAAFACALWLDPVLRQRILAFLHPELYKDGPARQALQSLGAFGSGGWFGRGLGSSRQKLGFIPEHQTDFIFPIIGEELGLVATLLVVLAFIVIVICGISIALRARDAFGRLLGTGLSFLIAFQAIINLGVVTSVLPNKGIPLPFISYGGSNLLLMFGCVGILLSIARHSVAAEANALRPMENESVPSFQPT